MPKANCSEILNQSLLDKGLKIIVCAFNEQKKEYSKNILQMESEIRKLKEENYIYKNKLTILQQKLNNLSKTACVLDAESDEAKNQEKRVNSKNIISTLNSEYNNNAKKCKNNSVNNKFTLYKNFLMQNKNKNYHMPDNSRSNNQNKAYSNILQYNMKYLKDSPRNATYNKGADNFNYPKRRQEKETSLSENSYTNNKNSYLLDNTPKDNDLNICEESRTEREFRKRKIFSEKFLEINKKKQKHGSANMNKIKDILNINSNSSLSINDLNERDINNNNVQKMEKDLIYRNSNYNNNKNSGCEDEIYFKDMKISGDNNSILYKKLNIFLEECKVKLNALDYGSVINLLKSFDIDSNIDVRKKVKKLLNNDHKLCKLFDNIFET